MWRGRGGVPFLSYEKGFGGEKFRGLRGPFFLSSCWVAFGRPFYLWTVLPDVPRHWRVPPASGGHPPGLYPLRGVGFIAWRLRRPKKGNADGAEGILGLAGRVWVSALRPGPP